MSSYVPGSAAHDLAANLRTLKANAAFDQIAEMRANSPTGGALGSTSEGELALLEAVYAAIGQSQSQPQFLENVDRFQKQVHESWGRINDAYQRDYGKPLFEESTPVPDGVDPALWELLSDEEKALWN